MVVIKRVKDRVGCFGSGPEVDGRFAAVGADFEPRPGRVVGTRFEGRVD